MDCYKIRQETGKDIGLALIINITDFNGKPNKKREGSEKDVLDLKTTLELMKLKVEVKENLTQDELL